MGHFYVSQSDKGGLVYGGDLDGYNSYAQRGNLPIVEEVMSEMLALFPGLARVRVLRSWGGIMRHVDGRLADHHDRPAARHVSELRLVLRRLQGDAGLRLVLRLDDRQGRAAPAQRALHARPLPPRHPDRRQGPGRDAQAALGTKHADHLPLLRPARRRPNSPIRATATARAPTRPRPTRPPGTPMSTTG